MSPFLQMFRGNQVNNSKPKTSNNLYDWNAKLEDLKSGKADPKETALELVGRLSSKQKLFLKMALPMFQKFAVKNGVSDESINDFLTEIKSRL